jgi:hypothetical protein
MTLHVLWVCGVIAGYGGAAAVKRSVVSGCWACKADTLSSAEVIALGLV